MSSRRWLVRWCLSLGLATLLGVAARQLWLRFETPDAAVDTTAPARPARVAAVMAASTVRPAPAPEGLAALQAFDAWLRAHRRGEPNDAAEGVRLARARRAALKALIATDPRAALAHAVVPAEAAALPEAIRAELETRIDAFGRLEVIALCHGPAAGETRFVSIDGGRPFEAYAFGRRLATMTKEKIALHGIALDERLVFDEQPFRRLPAVGASTSKAATVWVAYGDETRAFASEAELATWAASVLGVESRPGEPARAAADSPWTMGEKRVLWMRADFPDSEGTVVSETTIMAAMTTVNALYRDVSGRRSSFQATVAPSIFRLAKATNGYSGSAGVREMTEEALQQARAADAATGGTGLYHPDRYDRWVLVTRRILNMGGSGSALRGAAGVWLNGTVHPVVVAHELGHNHGLGHANGWKPTGTSPAGEGIATEYGDVYDVMGSGTLLPGAHFNTTEKAELGYLEPEHIKIVSASGTYRIHRHDHPDAVGVRALRVTSGEYEFTVEHRRLSPAASFTHLARLQRGVLVHWTRYPATPGMRGTYLLDATPGSPAGTDSPGAAAGFNDAAFEIGESMIDRVRDVVIAPVSRGGQSPAEWIDVRIVLGGYSRPPTILAHPAAQDVAWGGTATLSVQAEGIALTYQWTRNGVPMAGATQATLTLPRVGAADLGDYTVTVTGPGGSTTSGVAKLNFTGDVPFLFTTVAGVPTVRGTTDGPFATARFESLGEIAVDAAGTLYVADLGAHVIRRIGTDGMVSTFAGLAGQSGFRDGAGPDARFTSPRGVVLDPQGNLYVTDSGNNCVRRISVDGVVTTIAGQASTSAATVDGIGPAARFADPQNLAIDAAGHLYVTESSGHTVRRIATDGTVTTLAGAPRESGAADGSGATARFNFPDGIAVDAAGTLYVADRNNHTIRRISREGAVTTWVGRAGSSGHLDGHGGAARLASPSSLAIDAAGNLYVATLTALRRVSPQGEVTTLGGTGAPGFRDGHGTTAAFSQLNGLGRDALGTLFLADAGNAVIRQGTPPGRQGARLLNLSVRTHAGTGEDTLIVGFNVAHGAKDVLVRAAGPTLQALGVGDTLIDPSLTLVRGSAALAENDDWGVPVGALLRQVGDRLGAFPFAEGAKDAALLRRLDPGSYSAQVGGGAGVALVELYDADSTGARINNVSARTRAGTGTQTLIVGFVVGGDSPQRVLVRGIGPTLGGFGVGDSLAAPQLKVRRADLHVAENRGWSGDLRIATEGAKVGAFALPADSKDTALVLSLLPGAYTAQVTGQADATGIALVEIYELP